MSKIQNILWRLLGRPELPPKDAAVLGKAKYSMLNAMHYVPRYYKMYALHKAGYGTQDIASRYNVTQTRVKVCLWKAYLELQQNQALTK